MKRQSLFLSLVFAMASCHTMDKKFAGEAVQDNVGQKFTLTNIVDTSGKQITLDFSRSDITLIDFWNSDCPPCIAEMKQFAGLIEGKGSKISIYSISLTQYWLWKPAIQEHKGLFAFLQNASPNWKQYNLLSNQDPKLKNPISIDRLLELGDKYKINYNPAYFVVDKTGKILARPSSAVEYLKQML